MSQGFANHFELGAVITALERCSIRMTPHPVLGEREIHLWSASLDVGAELLAPLLSEDERERAGRFRFERDRRRLLAGRGWLRVLLGRLSADGRRRRSASVSKANSTPQLKLLIAVKMG